MSAPATSEACDNAGGRGPVAEALRTLCDRLIAEMRPEGFWEGRLSCSALSTATAVSAISLAGDPADQDRIARGVAWIRGHQNSDGSWGDTVDSPGNVSTTLLCVAALRLAGPTTSFAANLPKSPPTASGGGGGAAGSPPPDAVGGLFAIANVATPISAAESIERAEAYLAACAGAASPDVAGTLRRLYGDDRTFAVPILMNCCLAGMAPWDSVAGLPFEMAALPHWCYKALRLHVVSYALPALIAIGLLVDRRNPPRGVLRRLLRRAVTPHVLEKLGRIQPDHGGFLDATPLTSFVAMALTALVGREQPVAARCLGFLRRSQRPEGSWPIDTNLSVWLTTAAVSALAAAGQLPRIDRARTAAWIAARQYQVPHPYTHAAPGAWAWTHLAGGVPDADDTAGAILALAELDRHDGIDAAVRWLLALQNHDGGWPTFCRGWGKLPFDKSAPDLTAHALRAICAAAATVKTRLPQRAIRRGLGYLFREQQADGSWIPLWFGNQAAPGQTNPVLGTSRVLLALEVLDRDGPAAARGIEYLASAQNADGGWGGAGGVASSLEETAVAVAALASWAQRPDMREMPAVRAMAQGVRYLVEAVARPPAEPTPLGLYFARLWYSEQLYPLIWPIHALGRAMPFGPPGTGSFFAPQVPKNVPVPLRPVEGI